MAFFVKYKVIDCTLGHGGHEPQIQEAKFYVGSHKVIDYDWEILEVQADSDELNAIKCQMNNIPFSRKSCQRWFGDMAQFIAHNIKFIP